MAIKGPPPPSAGQPPRLPGQAHVDPLAEGRAPNEMLAPSPPARSWPPPFNNGQNTVFRLLLTQTLDHHT